ncbi:MAG: hypothetical protein LQ343_003734 [Gyalolechia ehrenbergii]|nr:MAG: hypothetical protein LQ343_003734 [Gyalolechia ehrenbergii]
MQNTPEDISNVASGHKANLSNPNTSQAAKEHSKQVLESMPDQPFYGKEDQNDSKSQPPSSHFLRYSQDWLTIRKTPTKSLPD